MPVLVEVHSRLLDALPQLRLIVVLDVEMADGRLVAAAREHAQRPDWSITGTRYVLRSGATP